MYVELGHEAALKVVKQLVNELHYGKPNFLGKLNEANSVLGAIAYEMNEEAKKQGVKS